MNIHRTFLALAGIALACAAHAADIGECATPEAMTAKLKTEDQRSIASAQRVTRDKQLRGMIFTMSSDRSVGYILEADQPMGDRASKICVYNRLSNVRLFDARKPGTPPEVLLRAPDGDALRRCDELAREGKIERASCGSLNTSIRRVEAFGHRVMIQALVVEKQSDGTYKPGGTLATVSGRVGGSVNDFPDNPARGIAGDITVSSLPDGASMIDAVLAYPEYTPYGLQALPASGR